jgi:hypothetical protein
MPLDPVTAAIAASVVGAAMQQIANLPPPGTANVPAVGVPRMLPGGTSKGTMVVSGPLAASIDGKPMSLAPGVQMLDPFNVYLMPMMVQRPVPVRYLVDLTGAITHVWILSGQEAAQP